MEQNGDVKEIFRFNDDGTIMATVNGEPRTYTLDEAGVYQARMDANEGMYFAVR